MKYEHPKLVMSLRTRTRSFGTLNLALALVGRSTGWSRGSGKPRRTFVGHHRGNPDGGFHLIELVLWGGPSHEVVWEWKPMRHLVSDCRWSRQPKAARAHDHDRERRAS